MPKTILITGATDGIGRHTAALLASQGHHVVLHGRNPAKLSAVAAEIGGDTEQIVADLSSMDAVAAMAAQLRQRHQRLDVLINNAGVFTVAQPRTADGLDLRFVVNTIAPYLLTRRLLPIVPASGRIVNLSSAAQAPVSLRALAGQGQLDDFGAYAQSKLALTMWSVALAQELGPAGPVVVAVNPGSLLNTRMVQEAFGRSRGGPEVGARILARAATDEAFSAASGRYFDNDAGRFAQPHPDALREEANQAVVSAIEAVLAR